MLPNFLIQHLKIHKTSLGDNPCFPMEQKYPYDYKIILDKYNDVRTNMGEIGLSETLSVVDAKNEFSKLLVECKEREKPIRDLLNGICQDCVEKMLYVPEGIVIFDCRLTDKVDPKRSPRIMPEDDTREEGFQFDDVNDMAMGEKGVLKRRFINSLIQGASNDYAKKYDSYCDEIYKLDESLPSLYLKIMVLNDFILFNEENKINEKSYSPLAYVEVNLGQRGDKSTITAQGEIFPFLLQESIRGFFELFASQSLPKDNAKAKYLIHHADFVLAEQWDMMFGMTLWHEINCMIDDESIIPFYFRNLCCLPIDEFNSSMKEILSHTKKGEIIMNNIIEQSKTEMTDSDVPAQSDFTSNKGIITDDTDDEMFTLEEFEKIS